MCVRGGLFENETMRAVARRHRLCIFSQESVDPPCGMGLLDASHQCIEAIMQLGTNSRPTPIDDIIENFSLLEDWDDAIAT